MKEKCHALRIAVILTIVSFLICVFIWFANLSCFSENLHDFLKMLFGGILASSFVTLFVYWSEYKSAKRMTLEEFWFTSHDINKLFLKVRYLDLPAPLETICEYFNEKWNNQMAQDRIDQLDALEIARIPDGKMFQFRHEYRDAWCNILRPEYDCFIKDISTDELEQILVARVEQDAKSILKRLNEAVDDYIAIAQNSWSDLDKIMGHIEYFIGKKSYQKLYEMIYQPFLEMILSIKNEVYPYFSTYSSGEYENIAVVLTKMLNLQNKLFTVEEAKYSFFFYADFWTNMENNIEDFRTTIYRDRPKYQLRLEVFGQSFHLKSRT